MSKERKILFAVIAFVILGVISVSAYSLMQKPKEPKCPENYVFHKDKLCRSEEELVMNKLTCEKGTLQEESKNCLITDEYLAEFKCPDKTTQDNNKCYTREVRNQITTGGTCPTGSVDVHLTEYCGKNPRSAAQQFSCPEKTLKQKTVSGGALKCYTKVRAMGPPQYDSCGSNDETMWDKDKCYYDPAPYNVKYSCSGFTQTHLYDKKCYETVEKNISYGCATGFTKDGTKCIKTNTTEAKLTCKENYTLKDKKCVKESFVPAIENRTCDGKDNLLINNKCYKTTEAK